MPVFVLAVCLNGSLSQTSLRLVKSWYLTSQSRQCSSPFRQSRIPNKHLPPSISCSSSRKEDLPIVNTNNLLEWLGGHFNLHLTFGRTADVGSGIMFSGILWIYFITFKSKLWWSLVPISVLLHGSEILSGWPWSNAAGALRTADSCCFNLNTYLFCVSVNQ